MKIIYPGTFDPITHGHRDLVIRALQLFDEVVVAVAPNDSKRPLLSVDRRIALVREVLDDTPGVSVARLDGLLVDFASQQGARAILRGLRAVSDFEYEFQLGCMNRKLNESIETIFLTPSERFMFVSSTLVKEVARHGGDISGFVHPAVEAALGDAAG